MCVPVVTYRFDNASEFHHVTPNTNLPQKRDESPNLFLLDVPHPTKSWNCPAILYEHRKKL